MSTSRARSGNAGFSLVEVMVAVVVICIGLLGIAKMQALSLSNTNMSRQRSMAAIQAASIASSMHSNRQYWASFTGAEFKIVINNPTQASSPTVVVTGDPSALLQGDVVNDIPPTAGTEIKNCISTDPAGALPVCTAEQLAAFDIARWWVNAVFAQLPNPTATIDCPGGLTGTAPVSCTVQISWVEKAVAINAQEAQQQQTGTTATAASTNENPTFTLYVEP